MNIILDDNLLIYLLDQAAKKIVGKVCKRFEIHDNKDEIKKEVKELLYEHARDIRDSILNAAQTPNAIHLTNEADTQKK